MALDSGLTDYSSLTHSKRQKLVTNAGNDEPWPAPAEEHSDENTKSPEASGGFEPPLINTTATTDSKVEGDGVRAKTILKRGHFVSFVGLYLFTALVYFRPYEMFASLSWTSKSAFWIALATALIFVPAQLGIDGRLSIMTPEVKFVLLLVLASALSIPLATESGRAWLKFNEYLKVVLMFIVMVNVVRTKGRMQFLMWLILIASIMLSFSAVNDYRAGKLLVGGERISGAVGGMFQNPNDLALHLVTMIPIAAAMLFNSRNPLSRVAYALVTLILTAGVVVTFSRGGFLGLAVVIALMLAKLSHGSKIVFAIVIMVLVLAFAAFAPGGYGSRLSNTTDMSFLNRQDDLKRSIMLTIRHPIFGLGMDNFVLYSNYGLATHNAYTQVSSEIGVFGAVCYVLFLVLPLISLRKIQLREQNKKKKPWEYYFSIGLQASLVGYMVASFFASVAFLWYAYYLVGYAVCVRLLYEARTMGSDAGEGEVSA